jgi:hypothetical protein
MEEWKDVVDYENFYEVSSHGRFRLKRTNKVSTRKPASVGYIIVDLFKNGYRKVEYLHILVLQHFGPTKPTSLHECNHKDGNRSNNHIDNLEWVTRKENLHHRWEVLHTGNIGERHGMARLTEQQVKEIRQLQNQGLGKTAISRIVGVSAGCIQAIMQKKTWKHVT